MGSDTDYRSMVEGAWNEAEASSAGEATTQAETPAETSGGTQDAAPDAGGVGHAGTEAGPDAGRVEATPSTTRSRDASGRFAPKSVTTTSTAPPAAGVVTSSPATQAPVGGPPANGQPIPPPQSYRAPQSWTPAEREHFAKAPPEVQAAVSRREREAALALQEAAPARKFQEEFNRAVSPFVSVLRAEGVTDPMQAVGATLNLLTTMRMGTPQQKAQTVAKFIHQYGVDVPTLDGVLSSAPAQQAPPQPEFRDPRFDQLMSHLTTAQQQRSQHARAQQQTELMAFAEDPSNNFFEDVREDMADRIDALERRGQKWTVKDVYDQAVWARPELRDIMQKRAAAEAAKAQTASTQQARQAAVSVKSTPTTGASTPSTPKTYRDIVSASWDALER